jgi:hypothetical protein
VLGLFTVVPESHTLGEKATRHALDGPQSSDQPTKADPIVCLVLSRIMDASRSHFVIQRLCYIMVGRTFWVRSGTNKEVTEPQLGSRA